MYGTVMVVWDHYYDSGKILMCCHIHAGPTPMRGVPQCGVGDVGVEERIEGEWDQGGGVRQHITELAHKGWRQGCCTRCDNM